MVPLYLIRMVPLFASFGLFLDPSCHLIVWLSWLSFPHPCINSVNTTMKTYGGARLLNIFLWPNPQTVGQLILLYFIMVDD
jgi:hypothetical protein